MWLKRKMIVCLMLEAKGREPQGGVGGGACFTRLKVCSHALSVGAHQVDVGLP